MLFQLAVGGGGAVLVLSELESMATRQQREIVQQRRLLEQKEARLAVLRGAQVRPVFPIERNPAAFCIKRNNSRLIGLSSFRDRELLQSSPRSKNPGMHFYLCEIASRFVTRYCFSNLRQRVPDEAIFRKAFLRDLRF